LLGTDAGGGLLGKDDGRREQQARRGHQPGATAK
jgi:hypothetical protein